MKAQFSIPVPCHENWNNMTAAENGRFCSACVKSVIDFTAMNEAEVNAYVQQNSGKRICGRFRNEQLGPAQLLIPESFLATKMPFHRAFFFAALAVMGSTLFSCTGYNGEAIGDISVVKDSITVEKDSVPADTIKVMHTLGIMAVPAKPAETDYIDTKPLETPVEEAAPDKK